MSGGLLMDKWWAQGRPSMGGLACQLFFFHLSGQPLPRGGPGWGQDRGKSGPLCALLVGCDRYYRENCILVQKKAPPANSPLTAFRIVKTCFRSINKTCLKGQKKATPGKNRLLRLQFRKFRKHNKILQTCSRVIKVRLKFIL